MTGPLPWRSCSATFNSSNLSLGILRINWRLSVKSSKNLDSSVDSTGVQSRIVHLTWVLAKTNQSCTCCLVNGTRKAGLPSFSPNSWNLFLAVCVEMRTPVPFLNSFYKCVALFRLNQQKTPWRRVVVLSRSPLCLSEGSLWVRWRFHIRDITLCDALRIPATRRCKTSDSKIPTPRFISSGLSLDDF